MPQPTQTALDFMANRRSLPAKTFTTPAPTKAEMEKILAIALRVPDHGKLEPWRLVVMDRSALRSIAPLVDQTGHRLSISAENISKARAQYELGQMAVAVISSPNDQMANVPVDEQFLSAGALCMNILHAATASGWGACWLSGWATHDAQFCANAFGCEAHEKLVGLIHIATPTLIPPERQRPVLAQKITWRLSDR
jgi:nitroreductase